LLKIQTDFVNLVDSEGIPTLAQEDVKLEFFSDGSYTGEKIDDLNIN